MPPILHIVRHAQGLHNVFPGNDALVDPELTPTGVAQCASLREAFPHHAQLTLLAASPMRRALQTCLHAFSNDTLGPVRAIDLLQETSDAPNDTGSSLNVLRAEFGDAVDLSSVAPSWTDKSEGSFFAPEIEKVVERARVTRRSLKEILGNGDGQAVCVSHGGYVHFLTDDWEGVSLQRRSTWANCDYRSYQFVDGPDSDEVKLRETEESWHRRKGNQARPTDEEQDAWREQVFKDFAPHMRYRGP